MDTSPSRLASHLLRYPSWAHHPLCSCFDDHLLRFGSVAVCLGCTCLAAGLVFCSLALMWAWQHERWLVHGGGLFSFGMLCWLPTLAQPFWQWKPFKIASRFLLGAALPCLLLSGLVLPPLSLCGFALRLGFAVLFAGCFALATHLRKRHTPDPCATCPHGAWPFCAGNLSQARRIIQEARADEPEFASRLAELVDRDPAQALQLVIDARQGRRVGR